MPKYKFLGIKITGIKNRNEFMQRKEKIDYFGINEEQFINKKI